MERKDFHLGPGAASLILVAVVISMAILGLLSMLDARSDKNLSDRSTALITAQYEASAKAEEQLAALDELVLSARQKAQDDEAFLSELSGMLPEDMTLTDDTIFWDVSVNDVSTLHCEVRVRNAGSADRLTWTAHVFESSVGSTEME